MAAFESGVEACVGTRHRVCVLDRVALLEKAGRLTLLELGSSGGNQLGCRIEMRTVNGTGVDVGNLVSLGAPGAIHGGVKQPVDREHSCYWLMPRSSRVRDGILVVHEGELVSDEASVLLDGKLRGDRNKRKRNTFGSA